MNNTFTNNKLTNLKSEKLDWKIIETDMKNKLGIDIYESWLKKIIFVEEFHNYVLLSVPTRFIRDWITSRYLDQILQSIKNYKKEIIRIEFKIVEQNTKSSLDQESFYPVVYASQPQTKTQILLLYRCLPHRCKIFLYRRKIHLPCFHIQT